MNGKQRFQASLASLAEYRLPNRQHYPWHQAFSAHKMTSAPTKAQREEARGQLAYKSIEPSVELLVWIEQSLVSGVGRAQVYRQLLEQGYAMEAIEKAMYGFKPKIKDASLLDAALRSEGETNTGLYYAFANIKLTQQVAERLEDLRAQIYTYGQFMTAAQCKALITQLQQHFQPSTVVDQKGDSNHGYRTSQTAFLEEVSPALNRELKQQIAHNMGLDQRYLESLQVQRYGQGQQYKVHTDWFHEASPSFEQCVAQVGQRTWTCVVYLNDDFQGGGTQFTDLDITIVPKQGMALCWNNLTPLGEPNQQTRHCGLPVIKGYKYIISAWFREKPYD